MALLEQRHRKVLEKIIVETLRPYEREVWVFGSRARGDHQTFSDLDLLIQGKNDLPKGVFPKMVEALEESNLPIKVDLVFEDDLVESYKEAVNAEKILFDRALQEGNL